MSKKYYNKDQHNVAEVIVVGVARALWWLVRLPFKGLKKRSAGLNNIDRNYVLKKRSEITEMLKSDNKYETKHAILEADKLVDFILKKKGYEGYSFADRLRAAKDYTNPRLYEEVWKGHKVRNKVAHDENDVNEKIIKEATQKLLKYVQV